MMHKTKELFDLDEIYVNSGAQEKSTQKTEEAPQTVSMNADQRMLLRMLQDQDVKKVTCFGGSLIRRTDAYENPILSFAVPDMTEREITKAKKEYAELFRSGLPSMIGAADPFVEQLEGYTVFNFLDNSYLSSLREYCIGKKQSISMEKMMRKLVKMVTERYNRCQQEYQSLNCFSLDTIFVDTRGGLWLLPLRAFRNCFPCEIAPEAHDPTQACDETSDLYAAAYVSLEVANGGQLEPMFLLQNGMFKDCLLGIRQCRPGLKKVVAVLNEGAEPKASDTTEDDRRKDKKIKKDDTTTVQRTVSGSGLLEKLGSWWQNLVDRIGKLIPAEPASETKGTLRSGTNRARRPIRIAEEDDE